MSRATFPETTGQESSKPATSGTQSSSDIRNALSALFQGDLGALRARAQASPNMTIKVNPAQLNSFYKQAYASSSTPLTYAGGNTSSFTAPSANPRIDIVYLKTDDNTLAVITGDEASSPSPKYSSVPNTGLPICAIYLPTTATKIVNYEDQGANPTEAYIYADLRPFLNLGGGASANDMTIAQDNIALLAFRLAVQGSLSVQKMEDGVVDEYEDETGIDTGNSSATYDSTNDLYTPPSGDQTGSGSAVSGGDESGTDQIPTMSSNSAPSGLAFASDASYGPAWQAMDKNNSTKWEGNKGSLVTLGYIWASAFVAVGYSIRVTTNGKPYTWKLQGSNDTTTGADGSWSDLDTKTTHTITDNSSESFSFSNSTAYKAYRLYITATGDGGGSCVISEFTVTNAMSPASAFDNSNSSYWGSSQTTTNVSGAAYIGYDFGVGVTKAITGFTIKQHAANQAINSVKVQGSANGSSWSDVATVSITADTNKNTYSFSNSTAYRYWRLLANANPSSGSWEVEEIELTMSSNMDLRSVAFTAEAVPSEGRLVVFEEDVDAVTVNTDLLAYISRDNGSTYTQVTLADEGDYETSKRILAGSVSLAGQPSGSSMIYKLVSDNLKNLKIHGTALSWKE